MFDKSKYTIGWICAIHPELVAAQIYLDERHEKTDYESPPADSNTYVFGSIGRHNVVIASLPAGEYGKSVASSVARDLIRTFNNVKIGLMVGIAGGAPLMEDGEEKQQDIRLGDVVVSIPVGQRGGVYHYDRGKSIQDRKFQQTGHLNAPPNCIQSAVALLKAQMDVDGVNLDHIVTRTLIEKQHLPKMFRRPEQESDRLYVSTFIHADEKKSCTSICSHSEHLVHRYLRNGQENSVAIHLGLVASADTLMKDATLRNQFARDEGVLCFETEAAGLMNQMPFLIIRGICDYSDTHKNKDWQGYAAMTAAAYARQLLLELEPSRVEHETAFEEIKALIENHQSTLEKTLEDVSQIREVVDTQKQQTLDQNVLRWLSAPDETTNYEKASRVRHKGSGRWLIDNEDFQRRINTQPLLWMHGDPGCGKTVLATSLIDHLGKLSNENSVTLYFYFDFQDVHKQSSKGMLRSLVKQTYLKTTCTEQPLSELYGACGAGNQQPSEEDLVDCLSIMFEKCEQTRIQIIIDALDECTTHKYLFDWLMKIQDLQKKPYVIVTSQHKREIQQSLEARLPAEAIQAIDRVAIQEDIKNFVKHRIRSDQGGFTRWRENPGVLQMIESNLVEKSGGMFRWAACQLDTLGTCINLLRLKKALNALPQDLEETYSRTLDNIPQEYEHETTIILQLLVYSDRPLACRELVDAVAVTTSSQPAFDPALRLPDTDDLLLTVSSLVSYTTVTIDKDRGPEKAMQLSHASVKEYLLSSCVRTKFVDKLDEKVARMTISKLCVGYLLSLDHELDIEMYRQEYAFAIYAATTWPSHAMSVADQDNDELRQMIKELLTSPRAFSRVRSINPRWRTSFTPLICVALVGLRSAVQDLLDLGVELSAPTTETAYYSALTAASKEGHIDVARLLLDRGADLNEYTGNDYQGTALLAASMKHHFEVVKLLLDRGADPNEFAKPIVSVTPLLIAMEEGHFDVVELLLSKGADPRKHNTVTLAQSMLLTAARKGHVKLIQLMLGAGAKLNRGSRKARRHSHRITALSVASSNGQFELIKWLLQRDAVSDGIPSICPYATALLSASSEGHTEAVEALLAKGADPGARVDNPFHHSALEAAAYEGHLRVMQVLLSDSQSTTYMRTSKHLHAAIESASRSHINNSDGVRLLLDSSEDHFEPDQLAKSLMNAAEHGRTEIAQALLDGDWTFTSEQLFEAARKAARGSHSAVFELLSNAGEPFSLQNMSEELYHAASRGKVDAVRLLLAIGREIFAPEHLQFALEESSITGHAEVVQLLLTTSRHQFAEQEQNMWLARATNTHRHNLRMPQPRDVCGQ